MSTHTITIEVPRICESRKMQAIAEQSARNLLSLFADCEDDLQDSITKAEEAKVSLSHSITLDLGKSKQTDKLSFSLKRGDEICQNIPDPDQPELFREPEIRGTNRKDDNNAPALVGLPAPVEAIDMIVDAEIIEPSSDETPVIDSEVLTKAYADSNVDPAEYPWCGVDENGDVYAYAERPHLLDDNSWFVESRNYHEVLDIDAFLEPALWNYNGAEFAKVEDEPSEEGGEA